MNARASLFESLREKAERALVYPLNRDECLALVNEGKRLESDLDYFVRHEGIARKRVYELERERDALYGELNVALGSLAPEAWDRIKEKAGLRDN